VEVNKVCISLANHPSPPRTLKLLNYHFILDVVSKVGWLPFFALDPEWRSAEDRLLNYRFRGNWHWARSHYILKLDLIAQRVDQIFTHPIVFWIVRFKIHTSENLGLYLWPCLIKVQVDFWSTVIDIVIKIIVLDNILSHVNSETLRVISLS
jgi:hypothetical protein